MSLPVEFEQRYEFKCYKHQVSQVVCPFDDKGRPVHNRCWIDGKFLPLPKSAKQYRQKILANRRIKQRAIENGAFSEQFE